jgi:Rrf2 family transcriptional regulator, nitric oxide-sensitive transcriptional repressor
MQLSLHADYALRVLIYLGTHPERVVSTHEISDAYGISKNHLVRVIHTLAENQYVNIHAGRSGGVTLRRLPHLIPLGDVIRSAEPNLRLAECFDQKANTCPIASACALKGILNEALKAFMSELNRHTIADILRDGGQQKLVRLFAIGRSDGS